MKSKLAKDIGKKIKFFRTNHLRLSQETLALRAGVNTSHLSHLERGDRSARLETLLKISRALHVPIAKILPGMEKTARSSDPITTEIVDIISKRSLSEKRTLLRLLRTYFSKD